MRLLLDTRPLRESPAFRRLWVGSGLSAIGTQLTLFAAALQAYQQTGSSLAVGGVGLAAAAPAVVFGLLGGSIVDSTDRRRLVLWCSTIQAVLSGALAAQAFAGGRQLWILYALMAGQSLSGAINGPARRTFLPALLPATLVPAGAALNVLTFHTSVIAGPALAGLIAATGGLRVCYLVDALSYAGALYGVARLPAMRPKTATRAGFRSTAAGLTFIRRSRVLTGVFAADLNATVLGMPFALFPAINAERFGGAEQTLGLLLSAPAVGGLLGSTLSGPVGHVTRQGRAMLAAGALWGLALTAFALAHPLWLALTFLILAGAADTTAVVFRIAMVQSATPDAYRGRVGATEYVVGAACPQLGNFRAGALAQLTTNTTSALTGGLSVLAGATLIALHNKDFRQYTTADSPHQTELETVPTQP